MKDFRETAWNHVEGDDYVTCFAGERKWVNRVKRDAERYPDDVKITCVNADGSLMARYPASWMPMPRPKKKRAPMSEEQRQAAAERLAKGREHRKV